MLHDHLTNRFGSSVGVQQGDSLSPSLFNLCVNNLASQVKSLNYGVKLGDTTVSILLYADDTVIITELEDYLQKMLDVVKFKVGVLYPIQQPGSYWDRSLVLPLMEFKPHTEVKVSD